jgi:hypothetical protein
LNIEKDPNMETVDPVDELLTPAQVAQELHTTTGSLDALRYRGTGPKFVKVGPRVLYRRSDLRAYLDARTMQRTGDVTGKETG